MCKKNPEATCLTKVNSDYLNSIIPYLKVVQSSKSKPGEKRKASEEIGTNSAIAKNAERHDMSFDESKKNHTEFRGCGVPDLVMEATDGTLEIKEAKGGKSSYGTRAATPGSKKRVVQCTPEYTTSIGKAMKRSNYKGRHPTVPCNKHTSPKSTCTGCRTAERNHRRTFGSRITKSMHKQKHRKVGVRGDYNETCAQVPEVINNYTLDKNGMAVEAH